ncbi:AMP-binding protein [Mycobacterium vicinigordonae]|uniref:AMP-binding protein n=1 Tax=Mycobacterium vicinigordonae TaxID=1719132 RepID=A0A7D6DZL9_9MYCO|nr:AMP-binding protein [Mycobacterium vicinigordonae]QLL06361.1 AMP-binding protein [Mycobacterium vicinigordonae]
MVATELNLGSVVAAVAARVPARQAVLSGTGSTSYGQFIDRSRRLAQFLGDRGIQLHTERAQLEGHQSGQPLLAQYLHNGPEYLEGLVGSFLARVAPFNVNYRYRPAELEYLLKDARPSVIQYHAAFAPVLREVLPTLTGSELLLQVADGSTNPLLPGAWDYERALASVPGRVEVQPSPDDLYVIYTGGTTGMPKGVLWRQGDVAVSTIGLRNRRQRREWLSVSECADAVRGQPARLLPCAPMMHGAAQWAALLALGTGATVVFPDHAEHFDAAQVWRAVQRHQVSTITMVGDAFALPLIDELERHRYSASSLRTIVSGGAALHANAKQRLLELLPGVQIIENIGSSESGILGSHRCSDAAGSAAATFVPDHETAVIAEDFAHVLAPGHQGVGWLARCGRIPLGYLGDAAKTARTFPVVGGTRFTVPGDRARLLADGSVQLLGRDSATINTGGEKVFAEEVESVLKAHRDVVDALVIARPNERWGQEVAALVVAVGETSQTELTEFCRTRLARYKAPRTIRFVEKIHRTVTGKPDYRWAEREVCDSASGADPEMPIPKEDRKVIDEMSRSASYE